MLDNAVTHAGTMLYKGGKIYIDGWELKEAGMCREHVIFACLYVAQELHKAAMDDIREPGGAKNTCADMPSDTPRDWLCQETRRFDEMFDLPTPPVAVHATDDICERLGRLGCDVLRIHGVDISDQIDDLIRLYRDGGDAAP